MSGHPRHVTDWHAWHEQYDDPASSLARRLRVVQRLARPLVDGLNSGDRILSLCAGDGRDILPVVAERPRRQRPDVVLIERDEELAQAARVRAARLGVAASVLVGDAGAPLTWADHLPVALLMLCGIFGNVSDEDIRATIFATPSVLTPEGAVIWTRGAFDERDLRGQVRDWFTEAGFREVVLETEPKGYGVGVSRLNRPVAPEPLPRSLFVFNR